MTQLRSVFHRHAKPTFGLCCAGSAPEHLHGLGPCDAFSHVIQQCVDGQHVLMCGQSASQSLAVYRLARYISIPTKVNGKCLVRLLHNPDVQPVACGETRAGRLLLFLRQPAFYTATCLC